MREHARASYPLATGIATVATGVDCTAFAPPHVNVLKLHADFNPSGTSSFFYIGTHGDASIWRYGSWNPATNAGVSTDFEVECDAAQLVDYKVQSASDSLNLCVMGFREP